MEDGKGLDKKEKPSRVPIARKGFGTKGDKVSLLTNHFKVNLSKKKEHFFKVNVRKDEGHFFNYKVDLAYEDGRPVEGIKNVQRKIMNKFQELVGNDFAYDGEKSLFTVGPIPRNYHNVTVVLEDITSRRNSGSPNESGSKTFKVEIRYTAKIPLQAIVNALRGQESNDTQEAIRVLDIVLRQHAAKQGALLVRQSVFPNNPKEKDIIDLSGGILGCWGFHSSFRATQSGLSLNIDKSTTTIIQPGPVMDFLKANQNVQDPRYIDWEKAKRMLKSLRITISPSNRKYKITGLSKLPCREQKFSLKGKGGEDSTKEVTVEDYFVNYRKIKLKYSSDFLCIDVGKPNRPTFFPVELCSLVSMQRYTKPLSTRQRASLVEKSRQKPQDMKDVISTALRDSNYNSDPMFCDCGVSISTAFSQVEGRVLKPPRLMFGKVQDNPRDGKWNFNNKTIVQPIKIENWAVVNFSARHNIGEVVQDLIECARRKGITIQNPPGVVEENRQFKSSSPMVRVKKMLSKLHIERLKFILCVLPERKNSELYGPWKFKCLFEHGIVTQCMGPPEKVNDQYLTNVVLKINAKLGGLNSLLSIEHSESIPIVSKAPTMILGMDVFHGPPGQSDVPSIAAVVSSIGWPLISKYKACVRTQSPRVEMIDNLFKPLSRPKDEGIISELLKAFFRTSGKERPENIIIFRDGVSESQFNKVLNEEFHQIVEACKYMDSDWYPKFAVIVCQKNHHTKFFQHPRPSNVPPGTVIDKTICHPRNNDFYLCAHAAPIGTSRPTHYHVLLDEIGFSADELQELVHSLSYVCQRSTTAISLVAPAYYAHLAAAQMGQIMKSFAASTNPGGFTSVGDVPVHELPKLHENVRDFMFFC